MGLDAYVPCECEHSDENPCRHGGELIARRLGNISLVGHVREFVAAMPQRFPIFENQVVYSGSHSGDEISPQQSGDLLSEAAELKQCDDELVATFASEVWELADISTKSGKPIVFA